MAEHVLTTDELPRLRYLEPAEVRVFKTDDGRVRVTIGQELSLFAPRFLRARPLTDPDRYLSLRGPEPNSKEVGLLRDWRRLDPESRRLVEAELERRYLYPVLTRIVSLSLLFGMAVCKFDTDRGPREVTLRDMRDNMVFLGEKRLLITDAEGNRFDIPNVDSLDPASRALLAQLM